MVPGWQFDQILPTLTEKAVEYIGQRGATTSRSSCTFR